MGVVKWTEDALRKEALKYRTRMEFKKGSAGAYQTARGRGLLDEVCGHMEYVYENWTKESLSKEALKYRTRNEFAKGSRVAYVVAKRRGIFEEICGHMKRTIYISKWTKEKLEEEAMKYRTRFEFQKGSGGAYKEAKRTGIFEEICGHMESGITKWTKEDLSKEALKYRTRYEFQKGSRFEYRAAHGRGLLDEICGHMECVYENRTKESLSKEALKYRTRKEFQNGSAGAYEASRRRGFIDEICGHMEYVYENWTNERLEVEALKYRTRSEFVKGSRGAYDASRRRGIFEEICGHMERAARGFDNSKGGILYDLSFMGNGRGRRIHKIGISNRLVSERVKEFGIQNGYSVRINSITTFEDGRLCASVERRIKRMYRKYRYEVDYDGPAFLKNGMTEVFTRDIFSDWLESEHGRETFKLPGVRVERIGA